MNDCSGQSPVGRRLNTGRRTKQPHKSVNGRSALAKSTALAVMFFEKNFFALAAVWLLDRCFAFFHQGHQFSADRREFISRRFLLAIHKDAKCK